MTIIRIFLFVAFILSSARSNGQLVPLSLEQRVVNSDVVFEGKVLSQSSAWDESRRHIYTTNTISVYKVFKGQIKSSTVELITLGGTVGDEREDVSYGLKLEPGSVGVFTCIPNTIRLSKAAPNTQLKAYSEIQGFIRYDLKSGTAKDVFNSYKNVSQDVYSTLQKLTHKPYTIVNKADFKIK